MRGLEMSFVTTAKTDEEGRRLLALLGMPFASRRRSSGWLVAATGTETLEPTIDRRGDAWRRSR